MNGVFETERSVEFLRLDQIGNRKTNIPWTPPPPSLPSSLSTPPPAPGLLASGAVQPVWDNVTVYSRSGPHTLAQALGRAGGGGCGGWWADMQREVWGGWRGEGAGVLATVTLGGKKRRTVTDWQIDGEMEKKHR